MRAVFIVVAAPMCAGMGLQRGSVSLLKYDYVELRGRVKEAAKAGQTFDRFTVLDVAVEEEVEAETDVRIDLQDTKF
eukprot:gene4234-51943_t